MLPKENRLDLKKEFFEIKKKGKLLRGKLFNFLFLVSKQLSNSNIRLLADNFQPPNFALIVSKKIDKRATKRNRVKRLLGEAIRSFLPRLQPGIKGVFLVKKEILEKNFTDIKNEIEETLKEANLFR